MTPPFAKPPKLPEFTADRSPMVIAQPLVIMFEGPDEKIICHLYPSKQCKDHRGYGLIIADLVRHVAAAFKVDEDDVWEWVDKERRRPTTTLSQPS